MVILGTKKNIDNKIDTQLLFKTIEAFVEIQSSLQKIQTEKCFFLFCYLIFCLYNNVINIQCICVIDYQLNDLSSAHKQNIILQNEKKNIFLFRFFVVSTEFRRKLRISSMLNWLMTFTKTHGRAEWPLSQLGNTDATENWKPWVWVFCGLFLGKP